MSAKLMGHVWDLSLPRSERDVLLAMADHADDNGNSVRPGVDHLAWKTDYSVRQVQRAIISLKAKRIIEVVEGEKGGRGTITEYRLFLHRAPKKTPWPQVRDRMRAERRKKGDMVSHAKKGDIDAVMDDVESPNDPAEMGDTVSQKGDTAAPFDPEKGDISDVERVTFGAVKGDIGESSLYSEPVNEPSGEPLIPPAEVRFAEQSDAAPKRQAPGADDTARRKQPSRLKWAPFFEHVGAALGVNPYKAGGQPLAFAAQAAGQFGEVVGHDVQAAIDLFDAFEEWAGRTKFGSGVRWDFVDSESLKKHAGKFIASRRAGAGVTTTGEKRWLIN